MGVGYFLVQHKTQLAGNKYVSKITVFMGDPDDYPHLLFYVATAPPHDPMDVDHPAEDPGNPMDVDHPSPSAVEVGAEMLEDRGGVEVLSKSVDGRNTLRMHVMRVSL